MLACFWEIRLFVNPSVFREFSVEINVLPSNPRLPPVKHMFQSLFITRRPLTNSNESLGDKWFWKTPCAAPIAHPAPGPDVHFFPLNPFAGFRTSSCPTSPCSSSSFYLVFNTHLKLSICLIFTNLFLPASVFLPWLSKCHPPLFLACLFQ